MNRAWWILPILLVTACRCSERASTGQGTIAECLTADGDVRFHPPRDVVWQSVQTGHRFSLGDWVRTAEAARAKIRFDSGSLLEMEPASTVIIETTGEDGEDSLGPLIALESGSVRGSTEKGVSRRVSLRTPGGERVSLSPEKSGESFDYRVSVRGSGEVELAVTSGSAEVQAGTTRSVLRAGEAKLVQNGRLSETERLLEAPTLLTPKEGAELLLNREQPIAFTWSEVPGAVAYKIELSTESNFGGLVAQNQTNETQWSGSLVAGPHHWRVSAVSASGLVGATSSAGRFVLNEKLVLEHLLAPPDGVEVESGRRRTRIEFSWTPLPAATGYELIISKDRRLNTPAVSRSVTEPRVVVTGLGTGQYYWGVFAQDDERTPLFREPFRLRVKRGAPTLEAPNKLDWR